MNGHMLTHIAVAALFYLFGVFTMCAVSVARSDATISMEEPGSVKDRLHG